jgi:IclR family transcriptional regulator, KDG regulon repressor
MDTTLAKGLSVIDWLARQQRPCGVSEVARALGLARSNAHRTLQTLVACGWAVQDAGSAYRCSLRLFELGMQVESSVDLTARLHPVLARLAEATGETIHLAVLDGAEIVYLDKFDSPLPVAAYSRIGGRAPAHCVASGKALLAAMGLDGAALLARLGPLAGHTPHTLTDHADLAEELRATRERGVAENRQEWRLGVCGLGAPVFDARGEPVAAVGMSVPSIRFTRPQSREWSARVLACARDASQALGFKRPASRIDLPTPAGPLAARPVLDHPTSPRRRAA